jgi:hypothetical protein
MFSNLLGVSAARICPLPSFSAPQAIMSAAEAKAQPERLSFLGDCSNPTTGRAPCAEAAARCVLSIGMDNRSTPAGSAAHAFAQSPVPVDLDPGATR